MGTTKYPKITKTIFSKPHYTENTDFSTTKHLKLTSTTFLVQYGCENARNDVLRHTHVICSRGSTTLPIVYKEYLSSNKFH